MQKIQDFTSKNIPKEIIQIWQDAGYDKLLPVQLEAIQKGVLDGESLLIVSPTSSGKTFIGEMTAIHHVLRGKKTLYLVPFKSLAEEKYFDFSEKYGSESIGFNIKISDRDHREEDRNIAVGNYDVAILTYEKLSALLVLNPGILDACQCIIVDEVQMLMDDERGANLELLLTKLKYVKDLQIIALSAVLDELNGFDEWLGLHLIYRKDRPVELRQGIILPDGNFHYREWNSGQLGDENFEDGHFDKLLMELLSRGEQIVIIRNSVRSVWQTAMGLENYFSHLPTAFHTIKKLNWEPETETRNDLLITLRHSIAFHHADCELTERRIIENGFRQGEIKILVATTTLSMGVNLPCKTVILADNFKWDFLRGGLQQVSWRVGEVQNIFGRAGRLGKSQDFGRGIFLAENEGEMLKLNGAYIDAPLEILRSALQDEHMGRWALDIIATGFGKSKTHVFDFVRASFAAQNRSDWEIEKLVLAIDEAIQRNLDNRLLEKGERGTLQATNLGKVCAAKGVSVDTFNHLKVYTQSISDIDVLDVIFASALASEVRFEYYRGVRWFDRHRRQKITHRLGELQNDGELVGYIGKEFQKIWRVFDEHHAPQFTIALLAKDILKSHHSSQELWEAYQLTNASMKNMCLNLSWMLDTLSGIADVEYPQISHQLHKFAQCVKNCAPLDSSGLNDIQIKFGRDERIRLVESGFKIEDDFIGVSSHDFEGIIDNQKADQIIKHILNKRKKNYFFWQEDHKRRLANFHINTDFIESIYVGQEDVFLAGIINLFEGDFCNCTVIKNPDRKKDEPVLMMIFPDRKEMTILISISDDGMYIDSKTAGEVISQSARFHPHGYICIGRPDFSDLAKEQAEHLAKDYNFKLLPISLLIELYVRFVEKKIDKVRVSDFFWYIKGYATIENVDEYCSH